MILLWWQLNRCPQQIMVVNWSSFKKEVEKVRCANGKRCSLHRTEGCWIANDGMWLMTEETGGAEGRREMLAKIRKEAPCRLRRIREWIEDPQTGQSQVSGVDVYFEPQFTQ